MNQAETTSPNPFSLPEPWSLVSTGYEKTTLRFLGPYSKDAIRLVNLSNTAKVLDVACGPGTLTRLLAPLVQQVHAIDFSPEMVSLCQRHIQEKQWSHVQAQVGDGQHLPYLDNEFDAAFSMFGLMFFPDRIQGLRELHRTLKSGGVAVISSWAPIAQSPAMQLMFNAMRAADPTLPEPKTNITSLENPEIIRSEMEKAGFKSIEIQLATHPIEAESLESFWYNLIEGSAPIVMMKKKAGVEKWAAMELKAKEYLQNQIPHFPATLTSDAWIAKGLK